MEKLPRHILRISKKVAGLILLVLVPFAIVLPGLPGDLFLVSGICLISDRIGKFVIDFIKKHKKLIAIGGTIWIILFWSYWLYQFIT